MIDALIVILCLAEVLCIVRFSFLFKSYLCAEYLKNAE